MYKTDYFAKTTGIGQLELGSIANVIADELDGYLHQYGYSVPIIDVVLLKYVASLNVFGTAAALERKGELTKERKGFYESKYDKGLQMLKERRWVRLSAPASVKTVTTEW